METEMPAKASTRKESIPARLRPFFWDVEFRRLKLDRDRDLIIRRLLDRGDWEAVQWLRTRFSDRDLKNWLVDRRGAGLSPPKLRFWELVLGLPEQDVNDWLRSKTRQVWDQRAFR
ncbi:MAG: hypothetical protein A4E67_01645 [Syntrophaceae bacterium PtaB.Bin038]|jgi:hypothetical protein|nr:MAG: hypothetical protein A4E67_01645 [Syntrophaceae bacterium PtaB.Bin038]